MKTGQLDKLRTDNFFIILIFGQDKMSIFLGIQAEIDSVEIEREDFRIVKNTCSSPRSPTLVGGGQFFFAGGWSAVLP